MEFVAIDVETANADMSSICQLGMAHFVGGEILEEWKTYIDPEDYFDGINVSIHGIDEMTVRGAPTLPVIADQLFGYLDNRIAVCHTHFDRVAVLQASNKYGLRSPSCVWLDSARVARRAWEQFASRGYGLESVCSFLGYEFAHHDALEDAKAAAHIVLAAIERTGIDVRAGCDALSSRAPTSSTMETRRALFTARFWSLQAPLRSHVGKPRLWPPRLAAQ